MLASHSIKTRVTVFTLATFVLCLWALALYVSSVQHRDMQSLLGEQQFLVVSLV